ncbi:Soluble inorganic pyrophosphatase 6, chloroplastic-like protein, partial [Drosera capensis]
MWPKKLRRFHSTPLFSLLTILAAPKLDHCKSSMAAARVVTANTAAASLIFKPPPSPSPFRINAALSHHRNLGFDYCFNGKGKGRVVSVLWRRRLFSCRAVYNPELIQAKEEGKPESLDYRVFFLDNSGKIISPWHDIPLSLGNGAFNFIVEIPKESSAKMEVATDELYTPVKQDTKKGKLRYYPYNINWNYGLLPQTWEDPSFSNDEVDGAFGDNDPVDVVEIGEKQRKIGEILQVKPLAALAMIDEGELDWKIVAIALDDPKASLVNDIDDVDKHFPGMLTAIRDWFRDYKIPDGKPANKFGLGNKPANKDYALKVINETNEAWAKLVKRSIPSGELSLETQYQALVHAILSTDGSASCAAVFALTVLRLNLSTTLATVDGLTNADVASKDNDEFGDGD